MSKRDQVITFTDGTTQAVRILPYDIIRVEREGKYPDTGRGLRLLHSAAIRMIPATVEDFDTWAQTVEDVESDVSDPVDPTQPAPGASP